MIPMPELGRASDIASVIQLAVAPVFLLSAVSAMLGVLSTRLGRIVDRARLLESLARSGAAADDDRLHRDIETLSRRAKLINRAIALSTSCALLICAVVAALFLASLLSVNVGVLIAALFVLAMMLLIGALIYFLREVFTATRSLRIGVR